MNILETEIEIKNYKWNILLLLNGPLNLLKTEAQKAYTIFSKIWCGIVPWWRFVTFYTSSTYLFHFAENFQFQSPLIAIDHLILRYLVGKDL